MEMTPQAWPDWYDGRHINEVLFCQQFLDKHPMKCVRGRLFTVDGLIEDEGQIGNLILEEISGVLTSGLSKVVTNLLASIKLQAYSPPLPIETDRIHVANGTYFMDGNFTADKSYCNNRLSVAYKPDAPIPQKWLQFLSELLQPEDIPTLQEFLGYCLLPTTKGQKMLMLIGKGGEGKSRIGLAMRSLLGDSMNTTSIQKVESNRFSRADLENKLLMVDDDMDMSALPKTNYMTSVPAFAKALETARKGILLLRYSWLYHTGAAKKLDTRIQEIQPSYERYLEIRRLLREKFKQKKALTAELKALSPTSFLRRGEIKRELAAVTEDMEELKSELSMLLSEFGKADPEGMKEVKQRLDAMTANKAGLENIAGKAADSMNAEVEKYRALQEQAKEVDTYELHAARMELRSEMTAAVREKIKDTFGKNYDYDRFRQADRDVSELLGEPHPEEQRSALHKLHHAQEQPAVEKQNHSPRKEQEL